MYFRSSSSLQFSHFQYIILQYVLLIIKCCKLLMKISPSASRRRGIPSSFWAISNALLRFCMWLLLWRDEKFMRSGRWEWIRALKPKPLLQLTWKSWILTPGYLEYETNVSKQYLFKYWFFILGSLMTICSN